MGNDINLSKTSFLAPRHSIACLHASHSGELSPANSTGRSITSAPYLIATLAIASSSVETNTASIFSLLAWAYKIE